MGMWACTRWGQAGNDWWILLLLCRSLGCRSSCGSSSCCPHSTSSPCCVT
ncbi:hypothetical protein E2C01_082544 [Portunus trituberculatus]|uniref:Uncharacterized protein n=1 Tax=Portunus trituberculatus TaxID=210409 RepID=A0A5B7IUV6_PORTR|nr:hypothetical protein [Portunus trituberculatus]